MWISTSFRRGIVLSILVSAALAWSQQQMSSIQRERAQDILKFTANDIKKNYYDPKFHGVDWDAAVAHTREQIAQSTSFNMAMSHIAAMIDLLHDSHTFFLPPQHSYRIDYGMQYQIIGDRCFITRVRPGSNPESKGIKPGDEILEINGYTVDRDDLWKIQYVFNALRPQPALTFLLKDPAGVQHQIDVNTKFHTGKQVTDLTGANDFSDIWGLIRDEETQEHLLRARYVEHGDDLAVIKVPEFSFTQDEVEKMISVARKHTNLILDLRGNPGGGVDTLKYLVAGIFDKEIKIADRVGRKDNKPETAKPRHPFDGKIVVLVDASSASAAEIFARIVQLEKRGVVIGDKTSGAVMEARHIDEQMGADTVIFYGVSVTESDLIMSDGKSLEHVGVTPDEVVLPSAQDLAAGRDPVLSRAAEILGVKITPEDAGKAFPYEWPPE